MSDGTSTSEAITVVFLRPRSGFLGDLRLEVVAYAAEHIRRDVKLLGDADERVVGVAEETLDFGREQRVVADLDAAVEHSS